MKLATVFLEEKEKAAVIIGTHALPLYRLNQLLGTAFPETIDGLIREEKLDELSSACMDNRVTREAGETGIDQHTLRIAPPYRNPGKIWGIGLNYVEHARDLEVQPPEQYPVGFNKPSSTIIGMDDSILIPDIAGRTTGEAELGVIIGRTAKNIPEEAWQHYVAGFVPVMDVTSLDILQLNPRYLTLSKSFDTFFGFGPVIYTTDEVENVGSLQVETWLNGKPMALNTVNHMRFSPATLVSFLSRIFTLHPGDIISTGTPGAVEITEGDMIETRISGFPVLRNRVKQTNHGSES